MVAGTSSTAIVISFRGGSGSWEKSDMYSLAGAVFTLMVWWFYRSAELGLFLIIVVDAIGSYPTLKKSYLDPSSENLLSWQLAAIASLVNLLAVHWTIVDASYPLYIALMMCSITGVLQWAKRFK